MRGTYVDVEGALRRKKCVRLNISDNRTKKRKEYIDGRRGEDLGISVVEVPELPDGQLVDGRRLGLWRYPEARHGSNPSGSYWGGRGTKRICCLHVRRDVGDVATAV